MLLLFVHKQAISVIVAHREDGPPGLPQGDQTTTWSPAAAPVKAPTGPKPRIALFKRPAAATQPGAEAQAEDGARQGQGQEQGQQEGGGAGQGAGEAVGDVEMADAEAGDAGRKEPEQQPQEKQEASGEHVHGPGCSHHGCGGSGKAGAAAGAGTGDASPAAQKKDAASLRSYGCPHRRGKAGAAAAAAGIPCAECEREAAPTVVDEVRDV